MRAFQRVAKRIVYAAIIVLMLAVVIIVTAIAAAAGEGGYKAYAEVDGVKAEIRTGDRIVPPQPLQADGNCKVPRLKLIGRGGPSVNKASIKVEAGADCSVVVTNVSFTKDSAPVVDPHGIGRDVPEARPSTDPPITLSEKPSVLALPFAPSVAQAATVHYRGWAKSQLHDFIHLDLTWVYAALSYYDY